MLNNVLETELQKYIHISKYSRWDDKKKRRENWEETVSRFISFWKDRFPEEKVILDKMYDNIYNLNIMPSMRCLMTAGKALNRDEIAGYNCTAIAVNHPAIFSEAFYVLLNGCGFGFSVERQYVNKLPEIAEDFYETDTTIIVRDSKIGWCVALKELISMLYNGQIPRWNLDRVRPAGSRLKTFGGRACLPGSMVLNYCEEEDGYINVDELYDIFLHDKKRFEKIYLMSYKNNGLFVYNKPKEVIYKDIDEVYEVETDMGFVVEATLNHRFLSENGYKELGDFDEGEYIGVSIGGNFPFDTIKSIRYIGGKHVYDICMEKEPYNFIVNDFISHNSGPEPLDRLFRNVVRTFKNASGRKLNSIECHDLLCYIAETVIVGSVRRSALISLSNLTDDRMRRAKDGQWWISNPQRQLSNNSVAYTEKPDLDSFLKEWHSLYRSKSGERGIFNKEGIKKSQIEIGRVNAENYEFIVNPCVTGDTLLLTDKGYYPIKQLVGKNVNVWNGEEWSIVNPFSTGYNYVRKYIFSDGTEIKATDYHKFNTIEGKKEAKNLKIGTKMLKYDMPVIYDGEEYEKDAYSYGFYCGDGTRNSKYSHIYKPKYNCISRLKGKIGDKQNHRRCWSHDIMEKTFVPINGNLDYKLNYLAGLCDADGHVQKNANSVQLVISSNNYDFLNKIRLMLNTIGCKPKLINGCDVCKRLMPDNKGFGKNNIYNVKKSFRLLINAFDTSNLVHLGLKCNRIKLDKVKPNRDTRRFVHLVDIQEVGICETFCANEEKRHNLTFNGMVTGNCGEAILRDSGGLCVSGDTPLITRNSLINIKDAVGKKIDIWNGENWSSVIPFKTGINKKLYRVYFSDGTYLDVTADHRWSVKDRFMKEWKMVKTKDLMNFSKYAIEVENTIIDNKSDINLKDAYTLGFMIGDGTYYYKNDSYLQSKLTLYGDDKIKCPVGGVKSSVHIKEGYNCNCVDVTGLCGKYHDKLGYKIKYEDGIDELFKYSKKSILEFFAGWIDADGCNTGGNGVRLYISTRKKAFKALLLLKKNGIDCSLNLCYKKGENSNFGNRNNDLYYLQITDCKNIPCYRVNTSFGKKPRYKGKYQIIKKIELIDGLHDVYCLEEMNKHKCVFGSVLTYQCNLTEIILKPDDTFVDVCRKVRYAVIMGTFQATLTNFRFLRKVWKNNAEEERLLGVSMTGIMDHDIFSTKDIHVSEWTGSEKIDTLEKLLNYLREYAHEVNKIYAKRLGINPTEHICLVKPSGCRPKDDLVTTNNGIYVLDEFDYNDSGFKRIEGFKHSDYNLINTYNNGKSVVLRINMNFGMFVESTCNHKWMVNGKGWVRADMIQNGDEIVINKNSYNNKKPSILNNDLSQYVFKTSTISDYKLPKKMNNDLAWMIGYLYGDGCFGKNKGRIRVIDGNKNTINKYKRVLKEQFGVDKNIIKLNDRNVYALDFASKYIWKFFEINGLLKDKSDTIDRIPLIIRQSTKENIISFISGLLDSDGCVNKKITYTTGNESFGIHIQRVALSVGIVIGRSENKIRGKGAYSQNFMWLMTVSETASEDNSISILMDNSEKCKKYNGIWKKSNKSITYKVGKVKSKEIIGLKETFDVETDSHWFWAGGFMSHNTVSVLCNTSSGIHPRYNDYYIKNVRQDVKDPLSQLLIDQGLPYFLDGEKYIFPFYVKSPECSVKQNQLSAMDQLRIWMIYKENWCDGNPSQTIYYTDDEFLEIGSWIWKNWDKIGGLSFFPLDDNVYEHAPWEKITKEQYEDYMKNKHVEIEWDRLSVYEKEDGTTGTQEFACAGGQCEI